MNKKLLVCDLDNTLYDWVGYFVAAFYAMVDEVVRITKCDRDRLLDDFRAVHQQHHDSESPFALLETRTVLNLFAGESRQAVAKRLDPAFHAFNASRKRNLRLYPGVREGLELLSQSGVVLVAHTESNLLAAVDRLTRLELTAYFQRIYCRERPISTHPDPTMDGWLHRFPTNKVVELSQHQRKPDPKVLLEICRRENIVPSETAYVGDSIARDVLTAAGANVFSIWAKYGTLHNDEEYQKLIRISHWTAEDIARERELAIQAKGITADYVLDINFCQILNVFNLASPSIAVQR